MQLCNCDMSSTCFSQRSGLYVILFLVVHDITQCTLPLSLHSTIACIIYFPYIFAPQWTHYLGSMGKRVAKFRANEKRFRPSLTDDRSSSHICTICKFAALDGIGLQMHLLQSPYCVSAESSLPASLLESDDESHHSSQYDMDDDVGLFSSDC